MSGERYVPNGVILTCTHGANFGYLQVTFHVDTSIYASNMATEGDRWPILNIPAFGACIATPNAPCIPSPVIWQQPRDGIYINRYQMLLENSTAKCMRGGTVSIHFTFANLQESPSGSFKRPSEYLKEGFDWLFGKIDDGVSSVRAGLAEMGAPTWLQNSIDQLAWNTQACVGIVEGAINGVVGLGELIYDVVKDPVGVGGAIVDSVCDGAKSAWDWMSKGENWTNAANDAWEWASDGENWKNAANDAGQWLKDNPRAVGNVAGEALLEVGAAALTGGGSLGASAARRAGKELVEEAVEQGVKKTIKEAAEEATEEAIEQGFKKSSLPEVITKKGGDPPGTRRNSAGRLIDEKTGRFVKDPNKGVKDPPGTKRNSAGQLIDEKTGRYVKDPGKKAPIPKPTEAYNRKKHYRNTPKKSDRKHFKTKKDEVVDHDPPLVKRYYDGDPKIGEKPGYQMTSKEHEASANDRSRMKKQPKTESDRQGAEMSRYSKRKKKECGL